MSGFNVQQGDTLPGRDFKADTVQLFLYNAAIWNPHRIHYDLPYTRDEEGHPQLLIDGPLQGDWLTQIVEEWLGEAGTMTAFRYSNRQAAYIGDVLTAEGRVTAVDGPVAELSLSLSNQDGLATTVATASVKLEPGR